MTKRKLMLVALSLCMVAILAMGGTLAYLTDDDSKTNVFTVGNVDITLTEPKWDETGSKEAEDAYPGEPLAKDPTVTNVGDNPCFVRVKVTGWDCLTIEPNKLSDSNITYRTDFVDDKLGDNWVYNETDDYFYYTVVLPSKGVTDALFDQIVIPTDTTNGSDFEFQLDVQAEAVQAQGALNMPWSQVNDPAVMTLDKIVQWFGICMPAETPAEG